MVYFTIIVEILLPILTCKNRGYKTIGRKAKQFYYNDRLLYYTDGNDTIRVSEDKTNKLYVLFHNKKRMLAKKDLADIAEEFFKVVDREKFETVHIAERPISIVSEEEILKGLGGEKEIEITVDTSGNVTASDIIQLTPKEICRLFADIYAKDPLKAETLSGIPYLAKLSTMDLNFHIKKSDVTLDDLLNCYINRVEKDGARKEKNKKRHIRDATKWWKEFRSIINKKEGHTVKLLSNVKKEHITKYIDEICAVASQPSYKHKCSWLSALQKRTIKPPYPKKTWARQRKSRIITILTDYIDENHLDSTEFEYSLIDNILTLIRNSKKLKKIAVKPKAKPQAIDVETFHKLYNASNLRWKAYHAFAVNCGFTFEELSDLEKTDLNLEKCELIQNRPKTEEFRAAKLHSLTCTLLKEYHDKYNQNNNTLYFFVSKNGKKLNAGSCQDYFRNYIRTTAGVDSSVTFKRLRKCSATIATQKGCSEVQIRLLMGQTLGGELGAYIENCIETVEPACKAVTEKYFEGLQ